MIKPKPKEIVIDKKKVEEEIQKLNAILKTKVSRPNMPTLLMRPDLKQYMNDLDANILERHKDKLIKNKALFKREDEKGTEK